MAAGRHVPLTQDVKIGTTDAQGNTRLEDDSFSDFNSPDVDMNHEDPQTVKDPQIVNYKVLEKEEKGIKRLNIIRTALAENRKNFVRKRSCISDAERARVAEAKACRAENTIKDNKCDDDIIEPVAKRRKLTLPSYYYPILSRMSKPDLKAIPSVNRIGSDVMGYKTFSFLTLSEAAKICCTSKSLFGIFQQRLHVARDQVQLQQLLQHVVRGEKEEAEELIEGYGVRVMTPDTKPEKDKIYITKTAEDRLQYSLTTSDGKEFLNQIITQQELTNANRKLIQNDQKHQKDQKDQSIGTPVGIPARLTSDNIKMLKPFILQITAERGQTMQKNRCLLLMEGKATDYSGRTIEATPYRAALGAKDVSRAKYPNEGMADMLAGYLRKMPKGEEEIVKQQQQQFPPGWAEEEKKRSQRDKEALTETVNAIAVAEVAFTHGDFDSSKGEIKVDAQCKKALERFREYLRPKEVIKTGTHFNDELLIEALGLFDENFRRFGGSFESPKNVLCWRQIIGCIQCYLPACSAQAFCQGLYSLTDHGQSLQRSLQLSDGSSFYSFNLVSRTGLSFDFAIHSYDSGTHSAYLARTAHMRRVYKTYVESKNSSLAGAYTAASRLSIKEVEPVRDIILSRSP